MDPEIGTVEAVAVLVDLILDVGTFEETLRYLGPSTEAVDVDWVIGGAHEAAGPHSLQTPSTAGMENLYTREGIATIAVADAWYRLTVLDDGDAFIHSGMAGAAQKRARAGATMGYRAVREPRSRSTSILHASRGACTTRSSSAPCRQSRTG